MEEDQETIARLQRDAANDVIIQNYDYLVGCVNAVSILPYLVPSGVMNQYFHQRLEHEHTDLDKMVVLLRELTRSPLECWFKEFVGALSKISQYKIVADNLQKDFTEVMEKKLALPPTNDGDGRTLAKSAAKDLVSPQVPLVVNVSGVDEVMKKTMEGAQAGQKAALSELQKIRSHLVEAVKVKVYAEAQKMLLEERVSELRKKLSEATEKSRETEMQRRLFEKATQSYRKEVSEIQERMHLEKMQLRENLAKLQSEEQTTRERLQDVEGERAALEIRVAGLQAEVERGRSEREDEVVSLQQQLSDAKVHQQTLEDELKRLWKETSEKQQRLESTTRQSDELQSNQEMELAHLQGQLERSTSRVEALEGELNEARKVKGRLSKDLAGLREELAQKSVECAEALMVQQKAKDVEKKFTDAQLQIKVKEKELKEVTEKLEMVTVDSLRQKHVLEEMEKKSRLARLEAELEGVSSTQELAVQELTQHKQEGKEKDLRIADLEDALQLATEEHRKLEAEIMMIEERTDRKIHDKNGEIEVLRDQLKKMEEALDQEKKEVVELREGVRLRQESIVVQQRQQQKQQRQQELTVEELTQRKQESEEKDLHIAQLAAALQRMTEVKGLRIADLEDALQLATEEHRKLEAEIMTIEERTDRKIHDKNGEIKVLRGQLRKMEETLNQEKTTVDLWDRLRVRRESTDMLRQQQQQGQKIPQYYMQYQPPQPDAPYVQPYDQSPIRYSAQGYPPAHRPTPTPGQPSSPTAPVPAPAPAPPRANEGQCPICHKNFAENQLQSHVDGHFEN